MTVRKGNGFHSILHQQVCESLLNFDCDIYDRELPVLFFRFWDPISRVGRDLRLQSWISRKGPRYFHMFDVHAQYASLHITTHHYISLLIRICICLFLRFDDMDYDAVISSAETTIGLVEAIRKSMAEQAGSLFVRKHPGLHMTSVPSHSEQQVVWMSWQMLRVKCILDVSH